MAPPPAGRIDRPSLEAAKKDAAERGRSLDRQLQEQIGPRIYTDARRAMWLDRLVRSLAAVRGTPARLAEPGDEPPADEPGAALVPLVLDALARRADESDAEIVGAQTDRLFALVDSPHRDRVARWLDLGELDAPLTIAQLLLRAPGSARRLAAALRAGVAELSGPVEGRRSTLPPPRLPELVLEPGAAPRPALLPDDLTPRLARFPAFVAPLADPLAPVEARLRALEAEGADGTTRARTQKELARIWQGHYGCVIEATRAYREAVAADPEDLEALDQAAVRCGAIGRMDLARAYAATAAELADGAERGRALMRVAKLALRDGDLDGCLEAASDAGDADADAAEPHELMLFALRDRGDLEGATLHAAHAAERLVGLQPARARALLAWAHHVRPHDPVLASRYAEALSADGRVEAAVAVLSHGSRTADDLDVARTLRLEAAERAEAAERPDLAAELLTAAFDAEPHVDVLHEPLVSDLAAAGALMRLAVVIEDIATVCAPEDRAIWLTRAGDAHRALPGQQDHAVELYARALEADPTLAAPIDALHAIAEETSEPTLLADAIERALRRAAAGTATMDPDARRDLLLELASLAEDRLGSAHRAAWAWSELAPLLPEPDATRQHVEQLHAKLRVTDDLVQMAERDLASASEGDRPRAARKLASMLRDHPEHRERVLGLYREALAADPADIASWSALERITWIMGEDRAMLSLLRDRAARTSGRSDRLRLLARLAGLEQLCGNHGAAVEPCLALLEVAPHHEEALARLARAARHLDDPALLRDVLERRARHADNARSRGQVLSSLALVHERTGDLDAAFRCATEALSTDPDAAEAALVRERCMRDVSAEEELEVLSSVRRLFGLSSPLALLLTDAAERAGAVAQRGEILDELCALLPDDPEPAARRVRARMEEGDPAALRVAIEHLLGTEIPDADVIAAGLDRLEQLAGTEAIVGLALHAVDRVGPALLGRAASAAERGGSSRERIAALERVVALSDKAERIEPLLRVAAIHRERDDRAAEARTLLRVLEVDPHDRAVLDRLETLYAEAGESERLMAVLALRLEAATDPLEQRERKLDLAAAAMRLGGDFAKADRLMKELAVEAGADADALVTAAGGVAAMGRPEEAVSILFERASSLPRAEAGAVLEQAVALALEQRDAAFALDTAVRALDALPSHGPLLLQFEHLALLQRDIATARRTYEALAARSIGPHGRRAFLYREARWLEKAGDARGALACYQRAFALAPSLGVIWRSIERLAEQLDDWEPLVEACTMMAERMPHADRRKELLQRAASLLEQRRNDPKRAFDILEDAWRTLGGTDLYAELRRLARSLLASDTAAVGAEAIATLVARLRDRAEKSWDDEDRAASLMDAAELLAVDGADATAAAAIVDETLAIDLPPAQHAVHLLRLSGWLRSAGRLEEARARAAEALARDPGSEARAAAAQSDAPEPEAAGGPPEAVADEPSVEREPPRREPEAAESGSGPVPDWPLRASEPPRQDEEPLRSAMAAGDLDAAEDLAAGIATDPSRLRESLDLLLWILRRDPSRVGALRRLHRIAIDLSASAVADVSAEVLSLFDRAMPIPEPNVLLRCNSFLERPSAVDIDARLLVWTAVMRLVWEGAMPLYKQQLADYQVVGTDRVTALSASAAGRAWADTVRVLGVDDVPLYVRNTESREVVPVATHPPAVVAGGGIEESDPVTLRFRLGRALELARPDHVLLSTLSEPEGALLVEAVVAAFGHADGASSARREAVSMAATLWNTVPGRTQQRIRTLLEGSGDAPTYTQLRRAVMSAAARSGAMVAGQVRASAEALLLDDPDLGSARLDTEEAYRDACRASAPLAGLMQFALSDAYLAARARAMQA